MTVSSEESRTEQTGDGTTVTFPYTFRILDDEHMSVYVDGVLLALTTDYTVTDVGEQTGGNVVFVATIAHDVTPADDAEIVFARNVPYTQLTDLSTGGTLDEETLEDVFDKQTMLCQQLEEELTRTLKLSQFSLFDNLTIPDPVAGEVLVWKPDLTGLINSAFSMTGTLGAYQDYGAAAPTTGTWSLGWVRWNTAPVTGGNVGWICVTAGTPGIWRAFGLLLDTDDILIVSNNIDITVDTTLSVPMKVFPGGGFTVDNCTLTVDGPCEAGLYEIFTLVGTGRVVITGLKPVEWWGALGDDTTNNEVAIQAAVDSGNGTVVLTKGTYRTNNNVYWKSNVNLKVHGGAIWKLADGIAENKRIIFQTTIVSNCVFEGPGILDGNSANKAVGGFNSGIELVGDYITVKGLTIQNMGTNIANNCGTGLMIGGYPPADPLYYQAKYWHIEGNTFIDCERQGFAAETFSHSTFINNTLVNSSIDLEPGIVDPGLPPAKANLGQIYNNVISGNTFKGVASNLNAVSNGIIQGDTWKNIISNNTLDGGYIYLRRFSGIISNNRVRNPVNVVGIHVEMDDYEANNVTITDNTVTGVTLTGAYVPANYFGSGILLYQFGIVGVTQIRNWSITNNSVSEVAGIGIVFIGDNTLSRGPIISGNKVTNSAEGGIYIDGVYIGAVITGNSIINGGPLKLVSTSGAVIDNNVVIDDALLTYGLKFDGVNDSIHLGSNNFFRGVAGDILYNGFETNIYGKFFGSFTMAAAATYVKADARVRMDGATNKSKIVLIPTNAAAATLQSGANVIYLSATTANTNFTVSTAGGGNAAGTETFDYILDTTDY